MFLLRWIFRSFLLTVLARFLGRFWPLLPRLLRILLP
ncbi:hypothetical protein BH23GEM4_BH23GEM4_24580 [soil metagenome]